ncbi:hypothetical protein ACFTAO_28255 [Paenibacillus rhizoplanae]
MQLLNDGSVAVMYASEKHVTENPSYSQIISQKISTNGGPAGGMKSMLLGTRPIQARVRGCRSGPRWQTGSIL